MGSLSSLARRARFRLNLGPDGPPQSPEALRALDFRLRRRAWARSQRDPAHHQVFDLFERPEVDVPEGCYANYFGVVSPAHYGPKAKPGRRRYDLPEIGEEYLEYVDILESVLDADGAYAMMEWGAGYGRWAGLAAGACRQRGVTDIRLGLVEAEPVHAAWLREHMAAVGLRDDQYRLYEVAMSGAAGETLFLTGMPDGTPANNPTEWYGQAMTPPSWPLTQYQPNGRDYHGRPELEHPSGWRGIKVPVAAASDILKDFDFVDLIDMDLQGAEADAVDECIDALDRKVRRLHIGTHAEDIEQRLKATLGAHGWILLRDLKFMGDTDTVFGRITCNDGIQSWFNPRHPPRGWQKL